MLVAQLLLSGEGDTIFALQSLIGAVGMTAFTYFLPYVFLLAMATDLGQPITPGRRAWCYCNIGTPPPRNPHAPRPAAPRTRPATLMYPDLQPYVSRPRRLRHGSGCVALPPAIQWQRPNPHHTGPATLALPR